MARAAPIACALVFCLSLCVALGLARARAASAPSATAAVAVWVTDRDADRVVGLDRNLLVVRAAAVRAPIEIEGRADGGAWTVSATNGDPLGRHRLLRLAADGSIAAQANLAQLLDLASDESGRACVVDTGPGGECVHLFDSMAVQLGERAWPGAACAATRGNRLLIGTTSGELALFDLGAPGAPPLRTAWGGGITDVAAGPAPDSWWALDAHGYGRLALLDGALGIKWSRTVGLHALHFAPQPGCERVWIADTTEPRVRRFGPGGLLELERADMPLGGLDRACATASGSAVFTAAGALLRLDAQGQNAPGQAGFDFLVDVAVVP